MITVKEKKTFPLPELSFDEYLEVFFRRFTGHAVAKARNRFSSSTTGEEKLPINR